MKHNYVSWATKEQPLSNKMLVWESHAGVKWSVRQPETDRRTTDSRIWKYRAQKKPWKPLLSCLSLNEESMMYLCLTLITLICLKVCLSSCMEEKMQPDPSTQTGYSIHPADPQYRWTQSFTFLVLLAGKLRGCEHWDDLKGTVHLKMTILSSFTHPHDFLSSVEHEHKKQKKSALTNSFTTIMHWWF